MEEEKRYKTPNGKILTESSLRQRFGEDFGKLVATGQFVETTEEIQEMTSEEVTMPTYVAPNGKEFTENELKDRFGNQWEDISVQFENKFTFDFEASSSHSTDVRPRTRSLCTHYT